MANVSLFVLLLHYCARGIFSNNCTDRTTLKRITALVDTSTDVTAMTSVYLGTCALSTTDVSVGKCQALCFTNEHCCAMIFGAGTGCTVCVQHAATDGSAVGDSQTVLIMQHQFEIFLEGL